jgi:hypothetical protein
MKSPDIRKTFVPSVAEPTQPHPIRKNELLLIPNTLLPPKRARPNMLPEGPRASPTAATAVRAAPAVASTTIGAKSGRLSGPRTETAAPVSGVLVCVALAPPYAMTPAVASFGSFQTVLPPPDV